MDTESSARRRVNSRDIGAKGELSVAKYFREQGGPLCWAARRRVATGWRNEHTEFADHGDIAGVPGLCLQVKALARPLIGKLLTDTWVATVAQSAALSLELGSPVRPMIIEKRRGTADVGQWWAHLAAPFYVELVTGHAQLVLRDHLVRVELGALMPDVRLWLFEQQAKNS